MADESMTSLRQLARLIGVDEKAVRKAITAGVFSESAVRRGPTGTPVVVNVSAAVKEWEKSGRRLRGSAAAATARPAAAPPADAVTPTQLHEATQLRIGEAAPEEDPDDPLASPAAGERDASLVEAQRMTMLQRERKLRLENDLREGQLIEVPRAKKEAFEFSRVIREAILNIPTRLSAELAGESDAARVFSRLDSELRAALECTVSVLESPPAE